MNPFLTIDSLSQLEEYEFIAHVFIEDDLIFKAPDKVDEDNFNPLINDYATIGLLKIKVLELFKGKKEKEILEFDKGSSCDLGISKGKEWILFGKRINGRIAIVACDRNEKYRNADGLRDWKYDDGFYELRQLRKLYRHPIKSYKNEIRKEYYSNGRIEIEEKYKNGKLNGERKIWYPNGIIFCKQYFINDTLDGKSEWFYPLGQIYDEEFYIKGKSCNVSRLYYDSIIKPSWRSWLIQEYKTEDSLNFVYKRVQPQYETVFNADGRAIISRVYTQLGKISSEETIDPERDFKVIVNYHNNGSISSISYELNDMPYGHYQEYDERGFPTRGWDYDENGERIRKK